MSLKIVTDRTNLSQDEVVSLQAIHFLLDALVRKLNVVDTISNATQAQIELTKMIQNKVLTREAELTANFSEKLKDTMAENARLKAKNKKLTEQLKSMQSKG
jgi:hypothetical protein